MQDKPVFSDLAAIHIRRGDFGWRCYRMLGWKAKFNPFLTLSIRHSIQVILL